MNDLRGIRGRTQQSRLPGCISHDVLMHCTKRPKARELKDRQDHFNTQKADQRCFTQKEEGDLISQLS